MKFGLRGGLCPLAQKVSAPVLGAFTPGDIGLLVLVHSIRIHSNSVSARSNHHLVQVSAVHGSLDSVGWVQSPTEIMLAGVVEPILSEAVP